MIRLIGDIFHLILVSIGIGVAIASALISIGYIVHKIMKRRK